jgi:hypothetical protein
LCSGGGGGGSSNGGERGIKLTEILVKHGTGGLPVDLWWWELFANPSILSDMVTTGRGIRTGVDGTLAVTACSSGASVSVGMSVALGAESEASERRQTCQ